MTNVRTEARLGRIKDRIRSFWSEITDDDVDKAQGNVERLVGTIEEKTGEDLESIRRTVDELLDANGDYGGDDDEDQDSGCLP
jgi:uncharacterized protein YjbJ (UPF0337 family)